MSSKILKPNQLSANNEEFDSNRESFSGRICDDLCEVLLSYLSFGLWNRSIYDWFFGPQLWSVEPIYI